MQAEAVVEIVNKKGLHARAAAKFVKTVATYEAKVKVIKKPSQEDEESPIQVDGDSILGLMMLGADLTSKLHISAEGNQAQKVVSALCELIAKRFGEEE